MYVVYFVVDFIYFGRQYMYGYYHICIRLLTHTYTIIGRLQISTRAPRQAFLVARVFFPSAPVRKASAVSGSLTRCPAPNMEDIIHHHQERALALFASSDIA